MAFLRQILALLFFGINLDIPTGNSWPGAFASSSLSVFY
jgi:hypothetical protein